ncbi:MAG: hypothetical protein ACFE89_06360 [Candidatus Hodarchaeota archaeon]
MTWLDKFKAALERFVGSSIKEQVLEDGRPVSTQSSPKRKAEWVKGAIERLDALVKENDTRREILLCCSHRFPMSRIKKLKREYQKHRDIDELLKLMHTDTSWDGLSYYEYPERKGNIIYVTKIPFAPQKFEAATDSESKRRAYCHCGWIRTSTDPISKTFCFCGSGWYKTLWEGILDKPVQVEVITTIASGDDECAFAIHLPEQFSKK